jgi:hypothetical protein
MSKYEEHFIPFVNRLDAKMKQGFKDYGDGSFKRPPVELIDEIEQEALDIVGWGYILWCRLEDLKKECEKL